MKRLALVVSALAIAIGLSGLAAAHPEEYETKSCPCIEVVGNGQKSVTITISRSTRLYQQDMSLDLRSVPVRGWVLEDSRGRLVAGYVLLSSERITSSHTIAPAGPVTLAPGRYTVTRLTSNDGLVRIPVNAPRQIRVHARSPRFVSTETTLATGPVTATATLGLRPRARAVFAAGGQDMTARARLDTCVLGETARCDSADSGLVEYPGRQVYVTSTTLLGGGETRAVATGSGVGALGVVSATALYLAAVPAHGTP